METASSLKFGTSGVRGLVSDLEGQPARRYVAAFLAHLKTSGQMRAGRVLVGYDLRPQSPAIARDCFMAIAASGFAPVACGAVPTPALALRALETGSAAIMVTGSHIPADRNGLKFYTPAGEIGKADEAGILAHLQAAPIPDAPVTPENETVITEKTYRARCLAVLPEGALAGLRIGVFEHSSVCRDLMGQILAELGAEIVPLGRSESFIPVDTEAFGDPVFSALAGWRAQYGLDAIVSSDGDADRPLLVDEEGQFVRGDTLGLLAARFLGARTLVTPVTSNAAIEGIGLFARVVRTRVGSPFVVAGMQAVEAEAGEAAGVIGFEANGGTFVGPGLRINGVALAPLPTRDALLPLLAALGLAARDKIPLSAVARQLPLNHALADRLQAVASERSAALLTRLQTEPGFAESFFLPHGIVRVTAVDGVQFHLTGGESVHFRASGNAPELRCYVEAKTPDRARVLLDWAMRALAGAL